MGSLSLSVIDARGSCLDCPANKVAICSALSGHVQASLRSIMMRKHFGRGQTIWSEGDALEFVGIVTSGVVKLIKMLPDGRRQIVELLFPSDQLGKPFFSEHQAFAEAAHEVELCCFPKKQFEDVMNHHPQLERALMVKSLQDLDAAHHRIARLGQMNATEKVAGLLLEFSSRGELAVRTQGLSETELLTFRLPLTRAEIGEYLGLTVETVSRKFTQLKFSGVIRVLERQTIQICRPARLVQLASEAEPKSIPEVGGVWTSAF